MSLDRPGNLRERALSGRYDRPPHHLLRVAADRTIELEAGVGEHRPMHLIFVLRLATVLTSEFGYYLGLVGAAHRVGHVVQDITAQRRNERLPGSRVARGGN